MTDVAYRLVHRREGAVPLGLIYEAEQGVILQVPGLGRPVVVGEKGSLRDLDLSTSALLNRESQQFFGSFYLSPEVKECSGTFSVERVLRDATTSWRTELVDRQIDESTPVEAPVKRSLFLSPAHSGSDFGQLDPDVLRSEREARRIRHAGENR
jgi:hypothetical protein